MPDIWRRERKFLGCFSDVFGTARWTRHSSGEAYEAPEELLGISLGEPNGYTAQLGALVWFPGVGKQTVKGGKQQPSIYVEIL